VQWTGTSLGQSAGAFSCVNTAICCSTPSPVCRSDMSNHSVKTELSVRLRATSSPWTNDSQLYSRNCHKACRRRTGSGTKYHDKHRNLSTTFNTSRAQVTHQKISGGGLAKVARAIGYSYSLFIGHYGPTIMHA
jgi:hypothetical protein